MMEVYANQVASWNTGTVAIQLAKLLGLKSYRFGGRSGARLTGLGVDILVDR